MQQAGRRLGVPGGFGGSSCAREPARQTRPRKEGLTPHSASGPRCLRRLAMAARLQDICHVSGLRAATATISVESRPGSFLEITREVERFVREVDAADGLVFVFL